VSSDVGSYKGGEALWGSEQIAGEQEFADFVPIDFADVEAEGDPAARADVGGQVVALGLRSGEGGVFSGEDFAGDGDDAVAVMIVEEVGEGFLAHEELRVGGVDFASGFRESQGELGKRGQMGVGGRVFGHVGLRREFTGTILPGLKKSVRAKDARPVRDSRQWPGGVRSVHICHAASGVPVR